MADNSSLALIEQLYSMISTAWAVPMSSDNKCIIERDNALEILEKLKQSIPVEMVEARRIVNTRDSLIGNAQSDAHAIKLNAEERARTLLDNHEIIRIARQRGDKIISDAEQQANDLKIGAEKYVANLLSEAEKVLSSSLDNLQNTRATVKEHSTSLREPVPSAATVTAKVKKQQSSLQEKTKEIDMAPSFDENGRLGQNAKEKMVDILI